uniref:Uncharacterized protein LOC104243127 n=1 Tax=Nicotiana sylvestris TaxID=4096 RepID=A0A1U7Y0C0_NICSY
MNEKHEEIMMTSGLRRGSRRASRRYEQPHQVFHDSPAYYYPLQNPQYVVATPQYVARPPRHPRRPHYRQGNRGPSSSGHRNSGQIYATTPVYQTSGRSHLGQCHVLTGECFRCGQMGHHLRDCPQPLRNFNQASIQSATPTQTTRNTSGATGQRNASRGQAIVFAFTRQDAQASNDVVTCILSVCSFDTLALIDPGSTHSYVSSHFAL